MLDPNIPMAGKPIDTATPIYKMQDQMNQNALSTEQVLKAQYDNMDAREKSRLQSTVIGATQLKTFLDRGDVEGAHEFLMRRQQGLNSRAAMGENIDTQETDYALDELRRGNVDQLKSEVEAVLAAGKVYGIGGLNDGPASVQEWQYFNSLSKEDQQRYLSMKRSNQTVNLGGQELVLGPDGKPVAAYDKTLAPADQPLNAQEKAKAAALGKGEGEQLANVGKNEMNASANRNYLQKAITLLPNATSGRLDSAGKFVTQTAGISTESSKVDRQLKILSAKLTSSVPRFEGPQGVLDVELYKEAAGDLANESLPSADRQAAAQFMLDLLDQYGASGTGQSPASPQAAQGAQPASPQAPSGQKVRVVKGNEAYMIDPADLAAAIAEGFAQQ